MAGQNNEKAQSVTPNRPPGRPLARDAFSVEEVGEILGISRGSAYAAAKAGFLPVIRIGHRCIIPRAALECLLTA
jgi:excisionase family DNA binding protein